jgi:hypothetical protein
MWIGDGLLGTYLCGRGGGMRAVRGGERLTAVALQWLVNSLVDATLEDRGGDGMTPVTEITGEEAQCKEASQWNGMAAALG